MTFTNAVSESRTPFVNNRWLIGFLVVFLGYWFSTLLGTTDYANWMLENLLVFVLLIVLTLTYRKYAFSDLSYLLICIYLLLHVYGAKYTYAENPFGYWLKDTLVLDRNHYDRIVHFSFGFLLAYPMRELFLNVFKFPSWVGWMLPIEITLSFSGLYELIEWAVADLLFTEQGAAYLGTQGDIWDAQKDMFLATIGAIIATSIVSSIKKAGNY